MSDGVSWNDALTAGVIRASVVVAILTFFSGAGGADDDADL